MLRTAHDRKRFLFAGVLAALLIPGTWMAATAAVGPGPKVYVFPYQEVFKGVSKEITTQTTDLLKNEIKHSDEVRLQKGPIFIPKAKATQVKPLSDRDLKRAQKHQRDGEKYYQQLNFAKAAKAFKAALDKYEKSAALLTDFGPVVDSLLMLSVCYYRQDQEDDGVKMLVKVIRLKPDLTLDPEKYPPMFRNTAEAIRKKLLRKARGEMEVVANTEGATAFFNGQKVGPTPILMKDLVPGEHFVRVEKEGLQTWAGKVKVVSTKRVRVPAALGGKTKASGPLGRIAEGLRNNQLTSKMLVDAQIEGKKAQADYVVLGGVAKVAGTYQVGSFLLKVADRQLCPLPAIRFDPDLLGASVEVYNMASVLYKRVEGCPDPVSAGLVALVQTAQQTSDELTTVALGPAVPKARKPKPAPPPPPVEPQPVATAPVPVTPAPVAVKPRAPVAASGPAVPGKGPAVPGVRAAPRPVPRAPAAPPKVVATSEGLATTGPSAMGRPTAVAPMVVPRVPVAEQYRPIDEQANGGGKWYKSWWFWTAVGVVVAGSAAGALWGAGAFDGDTSGASVTIKWPVP